MLTQETEIQALTLLSRLYPLQAAVAVQVQMAAQVQAVQVVVPQETEQQRLARLVMLEATRP